MTEGRLEHVNVTVSDARATADRLCQLFGWHIRWEGAAKGGGHTVHVGNDTDYVAVYTAPGAQEAGPESYHQSGGLNHIGVVVEDLAAAEARIKALGYTPHSHADYEPGRRFYFHDPDGIEFEVISYA